MQGVRAGSAFNVVLGLGFALQLLGCRQEELPPRAIR
jgi:hypothetical protein